MEPRTHYQVSFTSKQAMSVFIGLLAALGLAYFLGLMTGLSGREPGEAVAGAPVEVTPAAQAQASEPQADEGLVFPAPVTAAPSAGGPPPPAVVRPFEDRVGPAPTVAPVRARTAPAAGEFRVQVVSVSSRTEADAEVSRLKRRGLPARVESAVGPKGTLYRVRVGPYATREEAERASRRLAEEGRRDTWIVGPGP